MFYLKKVKTCFGAKFKFLLFFSWESQYVFKIIFIGHIFGIFICKSQYKMKGIKPYFRPDTFHRLHCFGICLDSWSFLQFDDFSWSRLRRQRWKNWCFHLLSEINYMLFHDLFYRNYDFWISSSRSLLSKLGQRHKKVRKLSNKTLFLYIPFILFVG